jgi:hypothetical protein
METVIAVAMAIAVPVVVDFRAMAARDQGVTTTDETPAGDRVPETIQDPPTARHRVDQRRLAVVDHFVSRRPTQCRQTKNLDRAKSSREASA